METMSYVYARMMFEESRDGREALNRQHSQCWEESREAVQEARLIGSKDLNDALFDSVEDTIGPSRETWINRPSEAGSTSDTSSVFQRYHLAMFEHCNRVREIARTELGITPSSLADPSEG